MIYSYPHYIITVAIIMADVYNYPDVGIRVNLSSCQTFVDLMLALERALQLARKHGHFPFGTVAEEVAILL